MECLCNRQNVFSLWCLQKKKWFLGRNDKLTSRVIHSLRLKGKRRGQRLWQNIWLVHVGICVIDCSLVWTSLFCQQWGRKPFALFTFFIYFIHLVPPLVVSFQPSFYPCHSLSIWGPISASFISFSSLMKQSGNSTSSVNEIQSICYLINSLIGILAPMPELITFQLQLF